MQRRAQHTERTAGLRASARVPRRRQDARRLQVAPSLPRRVLAALCLLAPALWIAGGDALLRYAHITAFDRLHAAGYAASLAATAAWWLAILQVACASSTHLRCAAGGVFVVLFTVSTAVQAGTFALYHTYTSLDSGLYVESIAWMLLGALPLHPWVVMRGVVSMAVACLMLAATRCTVPRHPRRVWRLVVPLILLAFSSKLPISYAGCQSTSPELIYFHGVSYVLLDRARRLFMDDPLLVRVQHRAPPSLPTLVPAPARPRNVLVVLQEALRADVTCSAYDPACDEANLATNHLLPERLPLLGMRANASSTLISFSTLFSGLDPTEGREHLHAAPLLWEYAQAAGYDAAFWTNQHPMFGDYRLFFQNLPLSHGCSGAELDPTADLLAGPDDELLTERVMHDWDALREPFFAVVQYSNIHFPRVFDPACAPFQPSDPFVREQPWRNYYKNVAYRSDLAVARLLRFVRARPNGTRTVLVLTSDHGEALAEHDNENFHAATVYEEEIRVPAFIDAPTGTLSPTEEQSLHDVREMPVFHLDLSTTLLDLLGLWDNPQIEEFRSRMPGRPLTRTERSRGPVPLTNVSWVWEYWKPNWGMMDFPLKVVALEHDQRYRCFDLEHDPQEQHDLGEVGCSPLVAAARERFKVMPADLERHLRSEPRWAHR